MRGRARQGALERIAALLDPDASYDGPTIVIRCESHADALRKMREARAALAELWRAK